VSQNKVSDHAHQRGTRLSKTHADEVVKLYGAHAVSEFFRANDLLLINYAYAVMLHEQGILSRKEAASILKCIRELEKAGVAQVITLDPKVGDLSTHMEAHIIKKTGPAVGGKIHTGRSRNDLYPTLTKMLIRRSALDVYEALLTLEWTLLSLSNEHKKTFMPGYTHHSQHAQVITLGYYLLGNLDVFGRDLARIEDFWQRLNSCPMGAAALATTGFPLNRQRMAELLGFDRIHEHGYDAISAKDFLLEYLYILSAIASDMGRLAENLLYWNTLEFNMVVLADEYTSFSTIMPQKKNPVSIESIRALNPIIAGKLFNALGILKAEPWSNGRETTILDDDSVDAGRQVRDLVLLLNGVLKTMTVRKERMYELARRGFSTATELADSLVRGYGFPFRTAHEVVGLVVKKSVEAGLDSTQITEAMVEEAVLEFTGRKISIDSELVRKALDPAGNVAIRNLPGGPAAKQMARMLVQRQRLLHKKDIQLKKYRAKLKGASESLAQNVTRILARWAR